jgi:hypothetical protein
MGIASLNLTGTPTGIEVGDPVDALILNATTFTRTDGTTGGVADAVFRYSSFEEAEEPEMEAPPGHTITLSDAHTNEHEANEHGANHHAASEHGEPVHAEHHRPLHAFLTEGRHRLHMDPDSSARHYDLDGMLADLRRYALSDPFEVDAPLDIHIPHRLPGALLHRQGESGNAADLDASLSRLVQAMSSFDVRSGHEAERRWRHGVEASEHALFTASPMA